MARYQGAVIAFDQVKGEPKWKWAGEAPGCSSPAVMTVQGTKQLVTLTSKSVIGLSLTDGKLLWQIPFSAAQGNNTTPVIDGQTVIYTGQGKGTFAVKIEAQADGFVATPLWTNAAAGARFTTPVLKDGLLFGYNNTFQCLKAGTGETLWTDATNRGNSGAIVDAGPVLLALTVNSELVAIKPSEKAYTELAKIKVADTETWAHPIPQRPWHLHPRPGKCDALDAGVTGSGSDFDNHNGKLPGGLFFRRSGFFPASRLTLQSRDCFGHSDWLRCAKRKILCHFELIHLSRAACCSAGC